MTREEMIDDMLFAQTPGEVQAARSGRDEWLKHHPEDVEVLSASSVLERIAWSLGVQSHG